MRSRGDRGEGKGSARGLEEWELKFRIYFYENAEIDKII